MDMDLNTLSTKEKIIKVTMDMIAAEGFHNVTIRKIANRAGVNIAAVNYHYGSKDAVINEALKTVTAELINAFLCLKEENSEPRTRLQHFIKEYSEILFKYPDIMKIIIDQNMRNYPSRIGYQKYLKEEGGELIRKTLKAIKPDESEMVANMRALQLLSCLAFPILMGDKVTEVISFDLGASDTRQVYTELLLDNIS